MNVFLHKIVFLARTLSLFQRRPAVWCAPRDEAKPAKGTLHDHDAYGTGCVGGLRKWTIAGLR